MSNFESYNPDDDLMKGEGAPYVPWEIADGTKVGSNNQEIKKPERWEEKESSEADSLKQSHAPEDVKKAEQKWNEIAKSTQAPAHNPNQTEAAKIWLQQQEALSQTFP
jgi:hypothetical protein